MAQQRVRKRKRKSLGRILRDKLALMTMIFLFGFIAVVAGTIWTAYGKGDSYKKRYLSQQTYNSNPIPYKRGEILDRRGIVLAKSVMVYNLVLEPKVILEKEEAYREVTVSRLSEFFGISAEEINKIIDERPASGYQVLKKDVSHDDMTKFQEEAAEYNKRDKTGESEEESIKTIAGYSFESYYRREYPLKATASDIIGFTNSGNVGEWGIEGYYNSTLNGKDGIRYGYFNSNMELEESEIEPQNGMTIVSTIDADAQKMTEDIIAEYQKKENAVNVGIIIMNPNNGEIYVMASDKGYDSNNPRNLEGYYTKEEIAAMDDAAKMEALNKIWRNYCISDIFEPGSTYKPFTVAEALENGVVREDEIFICDGFEEVADRKMHCVNRLGHGGITLSESLEKSCNDVMMQIVKRLGREKFARYQNLFGIGTKTGIDLPGEAVGINYKEEQLNPVELATNSFGQGVSVTMIQMAAGFSSMVNGGIYYKPHIVKEVVNDEGAVVESSEPVIMKKTVTKSTAEFIKQSLYTAVESGTGYRAKTVGYKVGGKTGTAQKLDVVDGSVVRSETNYVLSFVGCVPFDNPEAVIYVAVDQPDVPDQATSGAASMLAGEVIDKVLKVIGIYPEQVTVTEEGEE